VTSEAVPNASPRARFREMMRDDILAAARQIMQTGGYPALSMRALAEAVGVRAPTLYDYFASKEDVMNAVFMQGVELLANHFQGQLETTEPGLERLVQIGIVYRQFGIENPDLYQLLFAKLDQSFVPGEEQRTASKGLFEALRRHVVDALEIGALRPNDPDFVALSIWSAAHGYVTLELVGYVNTCMPVSLNDQYEHFLSSILFGLATPQSAMNLPSAGTIVPALQSPIGE
jgi:AcrR family transcriptional regulator